MCVLAFECNCVVYKILFLSLGEFDGEVVEDVGCGSRVGFNVSTKNYECGNIPYVVFDDFNFGSS